MLQVPIVGVSASFTSANSVLFEGVLRSGTNCPSASEFLASQELGLFPLERPYDTAISTISRSVSRLPVRTAEGANPIVPYLSWRTAGRSSSNPARGNLTG